MHTTQSRRSEEKARRKNLLFWSQENQVGEEPLVSRRKLPSCGFGDDEEDANSEGEKSWADDTEEALAAEAEMEEGGETGNESALTAKETASEGEPEG